MTTHWKRADEIVWEELDGGALLVHAATGKRWVLNDVATAIWKQCDRMLMSRAEIVEFCNRFVALGLLCAAGEMSASQETYRVAIGGSPRFTELGIGSKQSRRPSPRGNSGPG